MTMAVSNVLMASDVYGQKGESGVVSTWCVGLCKMYGRQAEAL